MVTTNIQQSCWPILEALARKSGFSVKPLDTGKNISGRDEGIEALATGLGLEVEPVEISYGELERQLRSLAPALIRLPGNAPSFVPLLSGGRKVRVFRAGPGCTKVTA